MALIEMNFASGMGGVVLNPIIVADVLCNAGTTTIYSSYDSSKHYLLTAVERYNDSNLRSCEFYIENGEIINISHSTSYVPSISGTVITFYHASGVPFEVILTQLED